MFKWKRFVLTAALTLSCLGMAAVASAEAKAIEYQSLYNRCYQHAMSNEFASKSACFYNDREIVANSWGEIVLTYTSGEDGSSTSYTYLGDLRQGQDLDGLFTVKRMLTTKKDAQQKELMCKIEDANFTLELLSQDEASFKLKKGAGAAAFQEDAVGDYRSSVEYPVMSKEAGQYVLERCLKSQPKFAKMLEGAGIMYTGQPSGGSHGFKIVEQHPDHIVTRGEFQATNTGLVMYWDIVGNCWQFLTE